MSSLITVRQYQPNRFRRSQRLAGDIADFKHRVRLQRALANDPGFDALAAMYGEVETAPLHHLDAALGLCEPTVVRESEPRWKRWSDDEHRSQVLDIVSDQPWSKIPTPSGADTERMLDDAEQGGRWQSTTTVVFKGRIIRQEVSFEPKDSPLTADNRPSGWDAINSDPLLKTRWVHGSHVQKFMGYVNPEDEREPDELDRRVGEMTLPLTQTIPNDRVRSYVSTMLRRTLVNSRRGRVKIRSGECTALFLLVNGESYPMGEIVEHMLDDLKTQRQAAIEAWRTRMALAHPARVYDGQGVRVFPTDKPFPKVQRPDTSRLHQAHDQLADWMGDPATINIPYWLAPVTVQGVAHRLGWSFA